MNLHEAFVTEHCLASCNQRGANRVTVAPRHTKSVPPMLSASKAAFLEIFLAVSAWILNDPRLNATRRSVNLSVYLVFDLEAGRF